MNSAIWRASFATTEDGLKTIMALLNRHAYLPVENLRYNRNFVAIIEQSLAMMQLLGERAHPPLLGPCARLMAQFCEVTDANYDPARLQTLRDELQRSLRALVEAHWQPVSMADDLAHLKATAAGDGGADATRRTDRLFAHLCRLAPLIYDHDGNAHAHADPDALAQRIDSLTPGEIADLYHDYLPQHVAPLLIKHANTPGFGAVHTVTRNTLNQFVPRTVNPALQLYVTGQRQVARRTITIEEVPPVYAALRGALAGDCSMVSVPFYGVLRTSYTWWIRKGDNFESKPAGYAILTLIERDGCTLPYILTINGVTLTASDCLAAIRLIAWHHGTDRLLLADMDCNAHYVNTPEIRRAFEAWPGKTVEVALPPGWVEVGENTHSYLDNFYCSDNARYARLVSVPSAAVEFDCRTQPPAVPYVAPDDPAQAPLLNRAVTLYYIRQTEENEARGAEAQTLLNLDDATREAVVPLIQLYRDRLLSPEGFETLHRHFGFGLKELGRLDLGVKGPLLRMLYDHYFGLFAEHEWVDIVTSMNRELNALIAQNPDDTSDEMDEIKDFKISLPDVYLPDYWQEVRPLLYLPNGHASAYHCQRFVKSFHSVGTIDAFLDFLLEHPDILESIDTEYRRWSDFFIRARDQLGFVDKLTRALDIAYLGHMRNTEKPHTCHHLAKTQVEYERILGRPDPELRREIRARQFTQAVEFDEYDRYYRELSVEAGGAEAAAKNEP